MSFDVLNSTPAVGCELDDSAYISKRGEARQRVLMRAMLHSVKQEGNVHVTDLSRSGLRGTADISLNIGQPLFVSFDDITHCSGTVRWTEGLRFGMKFGKLLTVLPDMKTDRGTMPGHHARMPRISTSLIAKIRICDNSCSAKIRNVSKSGMMVETDLPLSANQQLFVRLSDGKMVTADVKWAEGDRIGVQLTSPISILQFTYGDLK